ncbi:hypothetical protein GCM10010243_33970 [Streptomyces matensis]|nr:hypothetical protein GCM10010243_33970 [Streptomyces matensis]
MAGASTEHARVPRCTPTGLATLLGSFIDQRKRPRSARDDGRSSQLGKLVSPDPHRLAGPQPWALALWWAPLDSPLFPFAPRTTWHVSGTIPSSPNYLAPVV